jgi:glucose-6-phosphate isomerase
MKSKSSEESTDGRVPSGSRPFAFDLGVGAELLKRFDSHVLRRLSALQGQFIDQQAYARLLPSDPLIYEVYEMRRPEVAGELLHGITIIHPGRVGNEFFMTKGHYHAVRETAEIYYCLHGRGLLLMETEEGDWVAEEFSPGRVVYAAPCWAHRSINTGTDDLVVFFAYPGHAGHDYATIEQRGFRKAVIQHDGRVELEDNPRWSATVAR